MKKKQRYEIIGFDKDDAYYSEKEKYIGGTGYFTYNDDHARTASKYTSGDFILERWPNNEKTSKNLFFYMVSVKRA
jgi:hypothetical protein